MLYAHRVLDLNKFISILRGINVSGQKKIKMVDLKSLYELLGFSEVSTYIQSGNVIFLSKITDSAKIESKIEKAIEKEYGFHVPVIVRTAKELSEIFEGLPFKGVDVVADGTKILVTFLSGTPKKALVTDIKRYVVEPEKLVVSGNAVYLHCPNGYGRTKLSNTFIENKLKVSATTRNLKTLVKLCELTDE